MRFIYIAKGAPDSGKSVFETTRRADEQENLRQFRPPNAHRRDFVACRMGKLLLRKRIDVGFLLCSRLGAAVISE